VSQVSDLSVDTDALRAAVTGLREAASFAATARDRGGRLQDLAGGAGGGSAQAVGDFLHKWSYGLGIIGDDAETLAKALEQAAAAFEAVEEQLTEGLR
jgi:hypothetical protein